LLLIQPNNRLCECEKEKTVQISLHSGPRTVARNLAKKIAEILSRSTSSRAELTKENSNYVVSRLCLAPGVPERNGEWW